MRTLLYWTPLAGGGERITQYDRASFVALHELFGFDDNELRAMRIAQLSNDELSRLYFALSDEGVLVNVPALDQLEGEMRRRGLFSSGKH